MRIDVWDTSLSKEGVVTLANLLPRPATVNEEVITFKFHDAYIYQTGLVLLSTWRKALPPNVKVIVDDSECREPAKRLLTNSGFRDIVEGDMESPHEVRVYPGKIPLQPVLRGYDTEKAIQKIIEVFGTYYPDINIEAFRIMLSELCENAYVHSQFESPGYLGSNLHSSGKCEIAIADSGIGIRRSYLEGTNEEAKARIRGGSSAIELAVQGLSSSKPTPIPGTFPSYYGFGLFIIRRLIEENEGRLLILSDDEWVIFEKDYKLRGNIENPWQGTFVGILLDTDKPLPLEKIFDEGSSMLVDETILEQRKTRKARIALSQYGNQLLTREKGIVIRADLASFLLNNEVVEVDFTGITDLTPSVADEVFGKIAGMLGREEFERRVKLVSASDLLLRLITFVVNARLSKKNGEA